MHSSEAEQQIPISMDPVSHKRVIHINNLKRRCERFGLAVVRKMTPLFVLYCLFTSSLFTLIIVACQVLALFATCDFLFLLRLSPTRFQSDHRGDCVQMVLGCQSAEQLQPIRIFQLLFRGEKKSEKWLSYLPHKLKLAAERQR